MSPSHLRLNCGTSLRTMLQKSHILQDCRIRPCSDQQLFHTILLQFWWLALISERLGMTRGYPTFGNMTSIMGGRIWVRFLQQSQLFIKMASYRLMTPQWQILICWTHAQDRLIYFRNTVFKCHITQTDLRTLCKLFIFVKLVKTAKSAILHKSLKFWQK